jgi:hypothetical protein
MSSSSQEEDTTASQEASAPSLPSASNSDPLAGFHLCHLSHRAGLDHDTSPPRKRKIDIDTEALAATLTPSTYGGLRNGPIHGFNGPKASQYFYGSGEKPPTPPRLVPSVASSHKGQAKYNMVPVSASPFGAIIISRPQYPLGDLSVLNVHTFNPEVVCDWLQTRPIPRFHKSISTNKPSSLDTASHRIFNSVHNLSIRSNASQAASEQEGNGLATYQWIEPTSGTYFHAQAPLWSPKS